MNFDLNALSALMQLLTKSPAQDRRPEQDGYAQQNGRAAQDNYSPQNRRASSQDGYSAQYNYAEQDRHTSPFARENGIGDKVEISGGQTPPSPAQNPMASLLGMMGGKPAEGGDMMSTLMPMLLNMLKKPDMSNASPSANSEKTSKNVDNGSKYASAEPKSQGHAAPKSDAPAPSSENRPPLADAQIFSPISFAGYALISALNILYHSPK